MLVGVKGMDLTKENSHMLIWKSFRWTELENGANFEAAIEPFSISLKFEVMPMYSKLMVHCKLTVFILDLIVE